MVHWRRKWQSTPLFLLQESYEQDEKAKGYDTGRWAPISEDATGEEQRAITNSSRKNEVAEPKQKRHSVVNMSDGESKIYAVKNNTE